MTKLVIDWLGSCAKCGAGDSHTVETDCGDHDQLYVGDTVECGSDECNHTGVIDVDGDNAWCDWSE